MFSQNLISLDRGRGINPDTGKPWTDVPWISSTPPPSSGGSTPGTPQPVSSPGEVNTTDNITVVFGIEQLYGTYACEAHRSITTTTKPGAKASAVVAVELTPKTNAGTTPPASGSGKTAIGSTGGTSTVTETTESVSYTNLTNPYTGQNIINLANYNSVLNYYRRQETQAPSIFIKGVPNAIAVTLESNGKDHLRVSHVDYIKGKYYERTDG